MPFEAAEPGARNLRYTGEMRGPFALLWMAAVTAFFVWTSAQGHLLFHTLIEGVTFGVAFLLGIVAWHAFAFSRNGFLALLGLAFPAVGLLDLSHTLVYPGMNILPVTGANLATQLWIVARGFEALVLLIAPVFLARPLPFLPAASILGASSLLLLLWVGAGDFPVAYVEGAGLTPFQVHSQNFITCLLLAATAHLWFRRAATESSVFRLVAGAFVASLFSELAFTFYMGAYDLSSLAGHLFRLLAVWLIFRAVIAGGMEVPFLLLSRENSVYDAIPQPVVVVDRDGRVRHANRAARRAAGAEIFVADCHEAYHPHGASKADCPLCDWIARGTQVDGMELHFPETGRWMSASLTPLRWHGETHVMVQVMHDITLQKRGDQELRAANRALITLGAANQAVGRARDEEQLLASVCEAIVRKGGYRFAWAGVSEGEAAHTLNPAGWAGESGGYLGRMRSSWGGDPAGESPECSAVRTGRRTVVNNVAAEPDAQWRSAALKAGLLAIMAYPLMVSERRTGVLVFCSEQAYAFTESEITLLGGLAEEVGHGIEALRAAGNAERHAAERQERLSRSLHRTVEALAATVEKRDPYMAGHQRRTAHLAAAIGRRLRLPEEELERISVGGLVHDVGKICVPAEILNRPGELNVLERDLVRTHAALGNEIVTGIEFPWQVEEIVRDHHERLDGSGYPRGLKGEQIGLPARIVAVADVVEAMSGHRPHRPAPGIEAALKEIRDHAGIWFDEEVVAACEGLFLEGYRLPV